MSRRLCTQDKPTSLHIAEGKKGRKERRRQGKRRKKGGEEETEEGKRMDEGEGGGKRDREPRCGLFGGKCSFLLIQQPKEARFLIVSPMRRL